MADINNQEEIEKIDPYNFRQFIYGFPDQIQEGFDIAKNIKVEGNIERVVISGMGGSALPVNLIQSYLYDYYTVNRDKRPLQVEISRYYPLPPASYANCLNIISSYSGTTEETITALEEAIKNSLPVIGVSSGGDVERICKENGIPHVKLPIPFENFQPREGTGYFFASFYQLLINHGLIEDESEKILESTQKLRENMPEYDRRGKELSHSLREKTPVVYASSKYSSVAMIWKIKLNENAKVPAFWNYFPELNHNEMQGFGRPQAKFVAVMLKDPSDHPRNLKRYEATRSVITQKGVEVEIVEMEEGEPFYKMFSSILVGDFASYYLAIFYDQDPTPVDMVEEFKKILVS